MRKLWPLCLLLLISILGTGCSSSKTQKDIVTTHSITAQEQAGSAVDHATPNQTTVGHDIKTEAITQDPLDDQLSEDDDWQDTNLLEETDYTKKDPFEKLNRFLFNVHTGFDELTSKPAAKFYRKAVPASGRQIVTNFLSNLWEPLRFVASILALDAKAASTAYTRFMINTFLGAGGMFDVAKQWKGIAKIRIGGDTVLARYGIPKGPYLFIPYLGPSDLRGILGYTADIFLDPFMYLLDDKYNYARLVVGYVRERESFLDVTDSITNIAVDPYAMTRSLYMQHEPTDD